MSLLTKNTDTAHQVNEVNSIKNKQDKFILFIDFKLKSSLKKQQIYPY